MQMTLADFLDVHGGSETWSSTDVESYLVLCEIYPPLYGPVEMEAIAAGGHDQAAAAEASVADHLAGDGHADAAGIWYRGAQASREYAAAARKGWWRYEALHHDS
ncbi:hypothetical protein GCM10010371_65940 [Streptomyces subrutilus]|uniref:Uncharacterized protein n=1 Tax=Streptomyces subrutilus TaxID=36818 RepID=A0A918RJ45_9ACTN|nr:hypothetical protein [Streptomyces subrutilus]GGZ96826.1 hypothetical protein GCM10010371_65940 [Streptomyces subrutilus]